MQYTIHTHQKEKVGGEVVREILTIEATFGDGSTSRHGKTIPIGSDIKEEAVTFAAELEKILEEPKVMITEEVEIAEEDKEIKEEDIEAKLAEK